MPGVGAEVVVVPTGRVAAAAVARPGRTSWTTLLRRQGRRLEPSALVATTRMRRQEVFLVGEPNKRRRQQELNGLVKERAYYEPKGSVLDDPVERKRAEVRAKRFTLGGLGCETDHRG